MKNIVLYSHGGSKNHGCEAIVRSLIEIIKQVAVHDYKLLSMAPEEDKIYGLDQSIKIETAKNPFPKFKWDYLYAFFMNRFKHEYVHLDMLPYKKSIKELDSSSVALSIGGDNYCYGTAIEHIKMHELFIKQGCKTALWACSIEPSRLNDKLLFNDLSQYNIIAARETITYNALIERGLKNVSLFPDLAFILPKETCKESSLIKPNKTIGLNLSPLVIKCNNDSNIVIDNYKYLINYILKKTDYDIALIPHVVWENNDDRKVLQLLYNDFKDTGRVNLFHDHNCMQLKDIISKCRLFIGARTHATIAAYSSCVPTLVLGYSVKAKGIAKDIFGTADNYVLPVQHLKKGTDLTEKFNWLLAHESNIKNHLKSFMPEYTKQIYKAKETLSSLIHD